MQPAISHLPLVRRPDLALLWGSVLAAWLVTIALLASGDGEYIVDHDTMLDGGRFGWPLALLLFIASWQLMTAAMMLPSSMPMMAVFLRVTRTHQNRHRDFWVFLLGYFVIWTAFAVVALIGDAGIHWLVDNVRAVSEHQWLIGGSILMLAGAFQFSSLKERCLDACRDPLTFFWTHYLAGSRSSWRLGIRHGLFCLGCCWALMLTMFAVGMGSLVWMTALTGIMVIEKVTRYGNRLASPLGVALLLWGALVMLHPAWLPAFAQVA